MTNRLIPGKKRGNFIGKGGCLAWIYWFCVQISLVKKVDNIKTAIVEILLKTYKEF